MQQDDIVGLLSTNAPPQVHVCDTRLTAHVTSTRSTRYLAVFGFRITKSQSLERCPLYRRLREAVCKEGQTRRSIKLWGFCKKPSSLIYVRRSRLSQVLRSRLSQVRGSLLSHISGSRLSHVRRSRLSQVLGPSVGLACLMSVGLACLNDSQVRRSRLSDVRGPRLSHVSGSWLSCHGRAGFSIRAGLSVRSGRPHKLLCFLCWVGYLSGP